MLHIIAPTVSNQLQAIETTRLTAGPGHRVSLLRPPYGKAPYSLHDERFGRQSGSQHSMAAYVLKEKQLPGSRVQLAYQRLMLNTVGTLSSSTVERTHKDRHLASEGADIHRRSFTASCHVQRRARQATQAPQRLQHAACPHHKACTRIADIRVLLGSRSALCRAPGMLSR